MDRLKNKIKSTVNSLNFRVVGSIIILLFLFATIVETISYFVFASSIKNEYKDNTYKIAYRASNLINKDHLNQYLEEGGTSEEYQNTKNELQALCNSENLTIVYVISVDTSDYNSFTSIFNVIYDEEKDYTPWDIGYKGQTTNEEYRKAYKRIYAKEDKRETIFRRNNLNNHAPHITTLIPLQDSNHNVVGILCVQRPMSEIKTTSQLFLILVTGLTIIVSILVSVLSYKFFRKYVVKPITKIAKEAERFANNTTRTNTVLNEETSKITEIKMLAQSIDKMELETVNYINNLEKVTKENERVGTELKLAKSIQESALTTEFPDNGEYSIYAKMIPAKEVGGDFYDFNLIDENHLSIAIADVAGKGIPAALFMMVTKALINASALNHKSPSEILTAVNKQICGKNKTNMFITVWLGILDLRTGRLVFSNAGHEYPAIYRKEGSFTIEKNEHGIVVGAYDDYIFKDNEIKLEKGDKIFLYTDGVPEATNEKNEMFGLDKMVDSLNNSYNKDMETIIENVKKDLDIFVGDAVQFDDITMLGLEFKGRNEL